MRRWRGYDIPGHLTTPLLQAQRQNSVAFRTRRSRRLHRSQAHRVPTRGWVLTVFPEVALHTVRADQEEIVVIVVITREATARADLARQLPAESVLLMVPDYTAAVGAFTSGILPSSLSASDATEPVITIGGLIIDQLRQQVSWNGAPLSLSRLERGILCQLAQSPIRAWPYDSLYQAVWHDTWLGDASALHATAKRLRRKLRTAGVTVSLESVHGVGFRLGVDSQASGSATA